jgi:hypothetical protein
MIRCVHCWETPIEHLFSRLITGCVRKVGNENFNEAKQAIIGYIM